MSEVTPLPMKCAICKREIVDGMIYYHDKDKGYICEYCPAFAVGGISVEDAHIVLDGEQSDE